jgi:hypothetical protein
VSGPKKILALLLLFLPWLAAFVYDPTWFNNWVAAINSYWDQANVLSFLPLTFAIPTVIISCFVFYRLSPIALIGALQFLLFPVNDIYSSLPLALSWMFIKNTGSLLLILATAIMPLTYVEPNNLASLQLSIFLPLFIAAALGALHRQLDAKKI